MLPTLHDKTQILLSLTQIANEKMAGAIQKVSTQAGHNPSDYTLLSFGGAGGQHACALAGMLNMTSILIPYDAGLLSAYGIGQARIEKFRERLLLVPLEEGARMLPSTCDRLFEEGSTELGLEGIADEDIYPEKQLVFLRFKGQENSIEVDLSKTGFTASAIREAFKNSYERIYSHWLDHAIEVESVRVVVAVKTHRHGGKPEKPNRHKPKALREGKLLTESGTQACSLFVWEDLRAGATIDGPSIVVSKNSTTVVDKGWSFYLDEHHNAILHQRQQVNGMLTHGAEAELELFTNRFTAVAYEMGAMLQRTSFSINVKERLDFSCAVLDRDGYLVVNAPHIPVHLGSLGVCVREVAQSIDIHEGDVIITNHPAYGGSHLPDVTLIKGVFYEGELVAYVANRAHHAEIGGKKPGSMPADATTLEEEGVVISPMYLVRKNVAMWDNLRHIFMTATWPTRLWEENRADLNGALASINYGEQALASLCERFGAEKMIGQMLNITET